MPNRAYTFDAALELKDAGAVTASAAAQVGGSAKILDVGNAQFEAMLIVDVTTMDVANADERYEIILQGSNSATFASGIENLAAIELGASAARRGGAQVSAVGQKQVGIVNESSDVNYRYLRLYTFAAGTTPSINYRARLASAAGR